MSESTFCTKCRLAVCVDAREGIAGLGYVLLTQSVQGHKEKRGKDVLSTVESAKVAGKSTGE